MRAIPYFVNITFPISYLPNAKVDVIKSLRAISYRGLKECKDMSEAHSFTHLIPVTLSPSLDGGLTDFNKHCDILRFHGCEIIPSIHSILQELRELSILATKQGADELASEIIQFVLAEKLRGNV